MKEKRIPFTLEEWEKDKSQKVVTRKGESVNILSISGRIRPIAAFVGEEDNLVSYYSNGKRSLECDTMYDLFLVQEKEELSEFEKEIYELIDGYHCGEILVKTVAKRLLDLARKELEKDMPKWKKVNVSRYTRLGEYNGWPAIYQDGYVITICELQKLSHE